MTRDNPRSSLSSLPTLRISPSGAKGWMSCSASQPSARNTSPSSALTSLKQLHPGGSPPKAFSLSSSTLTISQRSRPSSRISLSPQQHRLQPHHPQSHQPPPSSTPLPRPRSLHLQRRMTQSPQSHHQVCQNPYLHLPHLSRSHHSPSLIHPTQHQCHTKLHTSVWHTYTPELWKKPSREHQASSTHQTPPPHQRLLWLCCREVHQHGTRPRPSQDSSTTSPLPQRHLRAYHGQWHLPVCHRCN